MVSDFAADLRAAIVAQRGDQVAQYTVTYTVQGRNAHDMTVAVAFTSTGHSEAYDRAIAYWRECNEGAHPGIREVVMTARNYWGELSVSGRWGVRGRAQWEINEAAQP